MKSMLLRMTAIMLTTSSAIMIAAPGLANGAESSLDEIEATLGRSGITTASPIDQNVRLASVYPSTSSHLRYRYMVISAPPTFFPSDGGAVDKLLGMVRPCMASSC